MKRKMGNLHFPDYRNFDLNEKEEKMEAAGQAASACIRAEDRDHQKEYIRYHSGKTAFETGRSDAKR